MSYPCAPVLKNDELFTDGDFLWISLISRQHARLLAWVMSAQRKSNHLVVLLLLLSAISMAVKNIRSLAIDTNSDWNEIKIVCTTASSKIYVLLSSAKDNSKQWFCPKTNSRARTSFNRRISPSALRRMLSLILSCPFHFQWNPRSAQEDTKRQAMCP